MTSSTGQPANFPRPVAEAGDDALQLDSSAAVTRSEIRAGIDDQAKAELDQFDREASITRRMADGDLVAELARERFRGRTWDLFATELVRYARSVLLAWQRTGHISTLLRKKGLGGGPTEEERQAFQREPVLFNDLTDSTIARALARFRETALLGGGWRIDGGATLTTYFMGACLNAYADELNRHRTEYRRQGRPYLDDGTFLGSIADRPDWQVASQDQCEEILEDLSDRERKIVTMTAEGYEQDEIAETLDMTARAVEGALYRMRKRLGSRRNRL